MLSRVEAFRQSFLSDMGPGKGLFLAAFLSFYGGVSEVWADSGHPVCPPAEVAASDLAAAERNTLTEQVQDRLKSLSADFFLDLSGSVQPDEILDQAFTPGHCMAIFEAPLPDQALWLRFTLTNEQDEARTWFVAFLEFIFDRVVLFEENTGRLVEKAQNGRTLPAEERVNTAVKTGLPVTIGPGVTKTFYLQITGTFAPRITPVIMTPELFQGWSVLTLVMTAVFLGYVGAITLFCVILFRHVEARFYQFYAINMACFFIFSFIYDGWLSRFLDVTLPVTSVMPFAEFIAGLGVLANIQYCRVLLKIGRDKPGEWRLLWLLSGLTLVTTCLSAIDPWELSTPLHLTYFVCPLALLAVALKKVREGLPQATAVSGALLSLTLGLSVAVYFFSFPLEITQAAFAYELILLRPLTWGYYLAVMGETTFMMLAISTMVKATRAQERAALADAERLRRDVTASEAKHEKILKVANTQIEALKASLRDNPERKTMPSAEQRMADQATECVLDHVSEEGFGARELAEALGTSQKTLGRRLKETHGLTTAAFVRSVRLKFARDLILLRQHHTITEIAYAAGFSSGGHFAKVYREEFGETPSETFKLQQEEL